MSKKHRCQWDVTDLTSGKTRKCSRKIDSDIMYCSQHQIIFDNAFQEKSKVIEISKTLYDFGIGQCCYCQCECNPMSQACGRCMREQTMRSLGWIR
jgi:hypothetical protein